VNGDTSIRPCRTGTSSGTRDFAWLSSSPTGSRPGLGENSACVSSGAAALASLPRATRSARLGCSTVAARAGLRSEAPVLDAGDLLAAAPVDLLAAAPVDLLAAAPVDFLAPAPSGVVVMATPSGPQRRDTTVPVPMADSCVVPIAESAPGRGCRHHPCRVIPPSPWGMVSKQAQFHGSLDRF
jgi:hypothetical protein